MSRTVVIFLVVLVLVCGGAFVYASTTGHILPRLFKKPAPEQAVTVDGKTMKLLPASDFVITTSTAIVPLPQPGEVKALYVTFGTAANPARIAGILNIMRQDGLNALVIDIKDTNGVVHMNPGLANLVHQLNSEGIYTSARMPVFQDNTLAQARPDLALKSSNGTLWKSNGAYWVDPASHDVWDYNVKLANQALDLGFQEVNVDYVRFPSDGNLDAAIYPVYDGVTYKQNVMQDFFKYFSSAIHGAHPSAVISADVFADSFLRDYDVGIGQRIKLIAPYVDVLAPMIYPSHYAKGNFGFPNPSVEPYQVVLQTLQNGKATLATVSSTVTVRPWIQTFDLGAVYTPARVQAEIQAVHDAGYDKGWMAWNASNVYNSAVFVKAKN